MELHCAETDRKIPVNTQKMGAVCSVESFSHTSASLFYKKEIERHQANNGKTACLNPFCKVIIVSLFDHAVRVIRIHNFSCDIILGKYFCISARPASRGSSMLVLRQCQGCPLQADIAPFVCLFFLSEKWRKIQLQKASGKPFVSRCTRSAQGEVHQIILRKPVICAVTAAVNHQMNSQRKDTDHNQNFFLF